MVKYMKDIFIKECYMDKVRLLLLMGNVWRVIGGMGKMLMLEI